MPQSDGGTSVQGWQPVQGWQFEVVSWNRARGGEPMEAWEVGRAHFDGGADALAVEGMPQALAIECLEAARLVAGLNLAFWPLRHRGEWCRTDAAGREQLLLHALSAMGLGTLSGADLSLVRCAFSPTLRS